MTTTMGDWNGTGSTWTTTIASITQATCTVPTTTGYDTGGAGGTVTITGFNPDGVTCAIGYTGTVTYTVCGSAGQAYSVSGCQAMLPAGVCWGSSSEGGSCSSVDF